MVKCKHCGAINERGVNFCHHCGLTLNAKGAAAVLDTLALAAGAIQETGAVDKGEDDTTDEDGSSAAGKSGENQNEKPNSKSDADGSDKGARSRIVEEAANMQKSVSAPRYAGK
ncbi:MAG: zinc ribbon domain-containing protein, partial [Candidatus Micrarchaeales archaeon]